LGHQLFDSSDAVEERVFAMSVEVDEVGQAVLRMAVETATL
jgi:hypothetical protein